MKQASALRLVQAVAAGRPAVRMDWMSTLHSGWPCSAVQSLARRSCSVAAQPCAGVRWAAVYAPFSTSLRGRSLLHWRLAVRWLRSR